jgi:hypothetical protein
VLTLSPPKVTDPASFGRFERAALAHQKARIWGSSAVRVSLASGPGSEARAAQALSLLRFLEASERELARLSGTHLRGLPGALVEPLPRGRIAELRKRPRVASAHHSPHNSHGGGGGGAGSEGAAAATAPEVDPRVTLPRLATVPRLGPANEARAWRAFGALCAQALAAYPTSEAEDDAEIERTAAAEQAASSRGGSGAFFDLGNGPDSPTPEKQPPMPRFSQEWNARVHVRGEKRVLAFWLRVALESEAALKKELSEGEGSGVN